MLLVAAGASSALTLGRAQGVALIGRPLDMGIQLALDAPADAADLCTEAEVFYGDNRVDSRRIDLSTVANGAAATLRLRVSAPVDEAFVQVYLRVGCTAKFTRRYVLLSEQPADLADAALVPTPVAPMAAQVLSPSPAIAPPAPAGSTRPGADAPTRPAARPAARMAPVDADASAPSAARPAARPATPKPAVASARPAATAAPAAAERPRLKLDALEVRPPAAAALPAARGASAAAPAASAAPAAETPPVPEALDLNAQRIQSLDAELRKLREGMLRSDAALIELRARLEKAEGERYANGLVYALAGLLAAALAAAFAFWRRSRSAAQSSQWWTPSRASGTSGVVEPDEALYEESHLPADATASARPAAVPQAPAAPAPAPGTTQNTRPASRPGAPGSTGVTGFGFLSSGVSPRSSGPMTEADGMRVSDPLPLSSDELSDIQQEADFFVSLGEYDRAIEILRNHIEAHPQASAVAWLDLLEIHHKLGQKDEYEQLRRDFEWLFNAKAPAFEEYHESREGLELHPRLFARIQAAWPRREVLEMIDEAIFRRPGSEGEDPLTLEGYRDLLFLHTLAADLSADDAVPVAAPLSALAVPSAPHPATPSARMVEDAVDLAQIDINLDELLRAGQPDASPDTDSRPADGRAAGAGKGNSNLMDFDLDLEAQFRLPGQRPPET